MGNFPKREYRNQGNSTHTDFEYFRHQSSRKNRSQLLRHLMKLIKIFFGLVIIFSLLLILVENTDTVSVNLLFHTFEETKVAVLILISVGIGVLIGYGLTVVTLISAKSELRSIKQKNQSITNELNDLRNVAIDQDIYDTENDDENECEGYKHRANCWHINDIQLDECHLCLTPLIGSVVVVHNGKYFHQHHDYCNKMFKELGGTFI